MRHPIVILDEVSIKTMDCRSLLCVLLITTFSMVAFTPVYAASITITNASFDDASNFKFTGNYNNISITAADVGKWVSRQANEDDQMDIADITSGGFSGGNTYAQDGSSSMLFQASSKRGLLQIVDVSSIDLTDKRLTLSAVFSARGTTGEAIMKLRGFNDLTGLTVDLGGDWSFTGARHSPVL